MSNLHKESGYCEYCKEPMKPDSIFGHLGPHICNNGHYPGQVIYINKNKEEFSEPLEGREKVFIRMLIPPERANVIYAVEYQ